MSASTRRMSLEEQIAHWCEYLRRRPALHATDVDELEEHLRNHVTALTASGLEEDEAFLIAVKRMGSLDTVSREFAREHSERLWKQLVVTPDAEDGTGKSMRTEMFAVVLVA